jgi:hypothetical protein
MMHSIPNKKYIFIGICKAKGKIQPKDIGTVFVDEFVVPFLSLRWKLYAYPFI